MLCKKPYMSGVMPYGCAQCLPCRINRRRVWTFRMMLESLKHPASAFVTLTYSDENLPPGGTLDPVHTQKWLKRIRRVFSQKLRYFLVGEYGDETNRPHYHLALFGVGPNTVVDRYPLSEVVRASWGLGHVMVGDLTQQSAAYVAGYVTKKMTSKDDSRLNGRYPEFARMSLRPGIGAFAMDDIANVMKSDVGSMVYEKLGDVPSSLNVGRKSMPLGRYLRRQLREKIGKVPDTPEECFRKYALEVRFVLEEAFKTEEGRSKSVRQILIDLNRQKVLNMEGRTKIYESRRSL